MSEQRLPDPPILGRTLSGRYALRSLLGRGGMGEVYEAEDLRLHRAVAVKVLRPELAGQAGVLERFEREARTAGSLAHPDIVAVHDAGVDGGLAYLVMELVHGMTLSQVIRAEGPLAPRRAARIAGRAAEALEFAHARGVVHRDVAPGNVMITDTGAVKVLDFGIARVDRERSTPAAPPSVHGTVAYLAPEQSRGDAADRRSDVYALGAVLFELLTGSPPPPGDGRTPPRAPGTVRAGVPPELDAVVLRCLAPHPGARFARAADLAAALAAAGGGQEQTRLLPPDASDPEPKRVGSTPVLASAVTLPAPAGRARPRSRRRWAAAGVTVLTGLAAWFVALPVLHALSDPSASPPRPAAAELRAPTYVSANGTCDGFWNARIDLTWEPDGATASAFDIYRADDAGGPYRLRARVDGTSTSWTDRGLGLDDTYRYVLRAVDGNRRSPLTPGLEGSTPLVCLG